MNSAGNNDRLPATIGGLLALAMRAYGSRAPLFLALALADFLLVVLVQVIRPDAIPPFFAAQIVGDALLIAAVAFGVGTYVAGEPAPPMKLLESAVVRWGDVAGATAIAAIIALEFVLPAAGFAATPDPLTWIAAPFAWLLIGALGLVGPVVTLGTDRPFVAILTGFGRAVALALRVVNLPRLAVLAVITMAPTVATLVLSNALTARGIAHTVFWANAPLDALVTGPIAAIQTAFALDFARRLGRLAPPR